MGDIGFVVTLLFSLAIPIFLGFVSKAEEREGIKLLYVVMVSGYSIVLGFPSSEYVFGKFFKLEYPSISVAIGVFILLMFLCYFIPQMVGVKKTDTTKKLGR